MTASNWNPSPIVQKGVVIRGAMRPGYEKVLTPEAIDFAVELEREFGAERRRLLTRRAEIQRRLDAGWKPDFLPETEAIRSGDWRVAAIPHDLEERRVEITGPTDRKIVINALNSGTNVFMADFEDANTPTWDNLIEGQANLIDAVRRTITFDVVRAWAAAALARVQPENPDAIPALVAGTRDELSFVRSLAAWHLGRLGPGHPGIEAVVPELRELLNDNDPSVRAEALVALENLAGKGAPPAELKSLAPTADPAVSPR